MAYQSTSFKALMARSWYVLQRNWILFAIMLIETCLVLFIWGQGGFSFNPLLLILLMYLHLAILSGWFYQMKRVAMAPESRTSWNDFFSGVSMYTGRMLAGGGYLLLICMGAFFAISLAINLVVTQPEPAVMEQLQSIAAKGENRAMWDYVQSQPELQGQLYKAAMVIAAGAVILGLFLLSLFFWPYSVVLHDSRWRQAWKFSQRFIRQAWRPLLPLAGMWLGIHVLFLGSLFTNQVILITLVYFGYLLMKTLLPLMTVMFLVDYTPERLSPVEEVESP